MKLLQLEKALKLFGKTNEERIAKSLFIDSIIYHLKGDAEAGFNRPLRPFFIEKKLLNYEVLEVYWLILEKLKLVEISDDGITFFDVWSEPIHPMVLIGLAEKSVTDFSDKLSEDENLVELLAMRHRLHKKDIIMLISKFVIEQKTFQKKYKSYSDCIRHFTFWCNHAVDKLPKTNKINNNLLGE
jgi:hypothetical protein